MLGRKPINKFTVSSIGLEEGTEFRLFDVKIPFLYDITVESTSPNVSKIGTTLEYYAKSESDLDAIRKQLENDRFIYKILKIEQATRQLTDLCLRCHKRGTPKIEKKDTRDYKEKTWRNKDQTPRKERLPELWLTYTHTKSEKCRICQYVNTPYPAYKKNNIEIEKYFFPNVIMNMEKDSF